MYEALTIGNLQEDILRGNDLAFPYLKTTKTNEYHLEGTALVHLDSEKIVGVLNGVETKVLSVLNKKFKNGLFNVKYHDDDIVLEIKRLERKLNVKWEDDEQPSFKINLSYEGIVGEVYSDQFRSRKDIKKLERVFNMELKKQADRLMADLQRQYKVDMIGLQTHLHKYHYKKWEKLKNDWTTGEQLFSKSQVDLEVEGVLRYGGAILNKKMKGVIDMDILLKFLGFIPPYLIIGATVLSFMVPMICIKVNEKFRQLFNPT
ncbi:Ger(x)C family germination protein [Oikeobacillus pervagus]|uniref:Ger(X)C family germination protein n=1 Tax=Oikeobacillus pervagus TaxID=1325931 RepID=A0AAJ1WIC8_9BACI|nr:Ger(x)C family spore germination C-terminal domain-containing protein [Oikeobacillus pervagus]MDQ0214213.1 Ger(x)C family germination protein [Oikeobacillus pervagus]